MLNNDPQLERVVHCIVFGGERPAYPHEGGFYDQPAIWKRLTMIYLSHLGERQRRDAEQQQRELEDMRRRSETRS